MSKLYGFLVILFTVSILAVDSLNFLVFTPILAASHKKFMSKLADVLTDAGHNVTLLFPDGEDARKSHTYVKTTTDVYYVERDEEMLRTTDPANDNMTVLWHTDVRTEKTSESHAGFRKLMRDAWFNFFRNPDVFQDMKNRNFDVAITEPLSVYELGFFKKLGIEKVILASSCVHFDYVFQNIGEPLDLSYVPSMSSDLKEDMDIFDRYENRRIAMDFNTGFEALFDEQTAAYRKYLGEELPDWRELMAQASLYFTNSNPYIDFPRPVIQKTVAIGGISVDMEHIRSQKMPQEWDHILNLRKKSMFISFGTIVKSIEMPLVYRNNLLDVIKSMPDVTFIWKYESNETSWASDVPNLILTKWAPQTALLIDPRLTAFLTHGGLGSTNEIAHCGKPALMVPVFADQVRNSNMLARHGGVIVMNKKELANYETVWQNIENIINDDNYQKNADRIASMLQNQPFKPVDLFLKHTEFVGKYGPFPQMDPHVRHLNFFQRTFLDIYLITAFCYISILFIILLSLKFLLSKLVVRCGIPKTKNE